MALVITALVDATPYRLRYLATQDGVVTSPANPDVDALATIPNAAGATPDLKTDILTASGPSPLQKLIDLNRDGGFGVTAGAMTQAAARAFLQSEDGAGAFLDSNLVPRAVIVTTPRTGQNVAWAADVDVDGSFNPVVLVRSSTGTAATAYIDIHFRHTEDL